MENKNICIIGNKNDMLPQKHWMSMVNQFDKSISESFSSNDFTRHIICAKRRRTSAIELNYRDVLNGF